MKVLITGSRGMLGTDVGAVFKRKEIDVLEYSHAQMDIVDREATRRIITSQEPDSVIHCAAHTNVDACQADPDTAYAVNSVGTINVAIACAEIGAVMVYISSCGIFDGQKAEPYNEFDPPRPLTHYHNSKYQGEGYVRDFCSKYFIIRPGWLFGGHPAHGKNFVAARAREARSKSIIESANDKFGSPTYTYDLAEVLIELVQTNAYGVYHIANTGMASRYQYVREIIRQLGLSCEVRPVGSDRFPRPAPVPNCEALDNMGLRIRGFPLMRRWQEALSEYIHTRFHSEIT